MRQLSATAKGIVLAMSLHLGVNAQVTPNINSGNPAFPFPQFLDYASDRQTLASHNPEGVPHIELEQRMRDAWRVYCNSFTRTGVALQGVAYLKGNIGCPYDCSEGDGYALLAAAYMADKTVFDGLWLRTHDIRMTTYPRYLDCTTPNATYKYGINTLTEAGNGDAAADGSFDVALALLMAWKQWGENMGIKDACGNEISYKKEALQVIRGLVEVTNRNLAPNDCRSVSGSIGFDGYVKSGNTWNELTDWASNKCPNGPEFKGPSQQHFDYLAPAYFRAFAQISQTEGEPQANIDQFKRAEASSDWLMGKLLDKPALLPMAGWVSLTDTTPSYSNFTDGEDFRAGWRTILNYVWHGNANTTWNPATHTLSNKPNTFERDIALRFARFLKDPTAAPWNNACDQLGGGPALSYRGTSTLKNYYTPEGKALSTFTNNWLQGTGSPAAVASQDFDLMAKMFRQCAIEWDVTKPDENILASVPRYFDGWFRLLGMLVLSGNAHTPLNMVPMPNLKVYHKVNKTVVQKGEEFKYVISYRNYGSVTATGTKLKFKIPAGLQFVSATKSGSLVADSVTWTIGTVAGFKTGGLSLTTDSVEVVVRAQQEEATSLCTAASITCANGHGWKSNGYPNTRSNVMERNCVDIQRAQVSLLKKSNKPKYNVPEEAVFTLVFENIGQKEGLNGGRPGVYFSFAKDLTTPTVGSVINLKLRLFHDADEPYINYNNYRFSYFLNDPTSCYEGTGCATGWALNSNIYEGGDKSQVVSFVENITPGGDASGKWNQRIVTRFAPNLATTTQHLSRYYGMPTRVHIGTTEPLRAVWRLNTSNYANIDWSDDWSWDALAKDADEGLYLPIGDDYTLGLPPKTVASWHKSACEQPTALTKRLLVEEWDGYTWRRVYGQGPSLSKPITNVVVRDTVPSAFLFQYFPKQTAFGVNATTTPLPDGRSVVSWTIPTLHAGQKDSIVYVATTRNECLDKTALSSATLSSNEAQAIATHQIALNCEPLGLQNEAADQSMHVYPNPTKETVYVHAPAGVQGSIALQDAQGNLLRQENLSGSTEISVTNLPNGVYFVEVTAAGVSKRTKVIVLR